MSKYVIVLGGNDPTEDGCNYLSSVDKGGVHFSRVIDDAITFIDKDRCVFLARALVTFRSMDVYSVDEIITRSFEYVW